MFCFGGRRPNMELQLPHIRRILQQHPDVEYHLWNLAKDPGDAEWLQTVTGDRITVLNDYAGENPWERFNLVYRHYSDPTFQDCVFVKLDDDVVFIETDRFGAFLDMVREHPDHVVSAKVINNGACTALEPDLWDMFLGLKIPLLDVHLHDRYAVGSHEYFLDHWRALVGQNIDAVPTKDWLSINLIGYHWPMAVKLDDLIGQPAPRRIAGRHFRRHHRVGDEGAVNMVPRIISQGFTACHLSFGPQVRTLDDAVLDDIRARYSTVGADYLDGAWATPSTSQS